MAFDLTDLTGVEGDRYDIAIMQKFVDLLVGIPKFSYPARRHGPRPEDIDGGYASIDLLEEYQVGIPAKRIKEQNANTTTYLTLSPALGLLLEEPLEHKPVWLCTVGKTQW